MQHIRDISWLSIGTGEGGRFMLVDRGHLACIVAEMAGLERQHPALYVFLRYGYKDTALQQLYP